MIDEFVPQSEAKVGAGLRLGIGLGMQRDGRHRRSGVCRIDPENTGCMSCRVNEHLGRKPALVTVVIHVAMAFEVPHKKPSPIIGASLCRASRVYRVP